MIRLLGRWLPEPGLVCVADSSFAVLELLDKVKRLPHASVIPRRRLDAALYDPPPHRASGTTGWPRLTAKRRPTLEAVLADEQTPWTTLLVEQWYGEGPREMEVTTDTAVWYHTGKPPVAMRWVLIRDPHECCKPQALLSTNLEHTPEQMLPWFVRRWTMEVTCEEARAHLGMEPQRQWHDRVIARTTPALLSLYAIITLTAQLQGVWSLTSVVDNGATVPPEAIQGGKAVFAHHTLTLISPDGHDKTTYTITLDPTRTPQAIDITPTEGSFKNAVSQGIYALDGETLRLCQPHQPTTSRPTTFAAPAGSGLHCTVLKKVTP